MNDMTDPDGQLTIRVDSDTDELLQLMEWFNDDNALRGRIALPPSSIRAGQMGDIYDVLVIALGTRGIAPALAKSLTTWFTVRRSDVTITLKRGDGVEMSVDAKRIKVPEVAQALQQMLEGPVEPQ